MHANPVEAQLGTDESENVKLYPGWPHNIHTCHDSERKVLAKCRRRQLNWNTTGLCDLSNVCVAVGSRCGDIEISVGVGVRFVLNALNHFGSGTPAFLKYDISLNASIADAGFAVQEIDIAVGSKLSETRLAGSRIITPPDLIPVTVAVDFFKHEPTMVEREADHS